MEKKGKLCREERLELWQELLKKGLLLGGILWGSTVLYLSVRHDASGLLVLPWLGPMLAAYLASGVILEWVRLRKHTGGGYSAVWWIFLVSLMMTVAADFLSAWIRFMLLLNVGVLLLIWLCDYGYLTYEAKKMNRGRTGFSLCISLKEKPFSKQEFLRQFEIYAGKENWTLNYEAEDVPAIVWINGVKCEVKLDSYLGFGGEEYMIKITEI